MKDLDLNKLGSNIRVQRAVKKMTQKELAKRVGKTFPTISNIENGNNAASIDVIYSISLALGCTVNDLVDQ